MKTYKVTITGQQKHIKGMCFTNQNSNQVKLIIEKYGNPEILEREGYPEFDGRSYELSSDFYITINLEKKK